MPGTMLQLPNYHVTDSWKERKKERKKKVSYIYIYSYTCVHTHARARTHIHTSTGWHMKCRTIDCIHNTFLLSQKHLTSGTELILIGWKIVPNEKHVQCDHSFASQPLANRPLHLSQLFETSRQKARGTTSLCGPWAALHFLASFGTLSLSRTPIKRNRMD
jgi:hypothetical protein